MGLLRTPVHAPPFLRRPARCRATSVAAVSHNWRDALNEAVTCESLPSAEQMEAFSGAPLEDLMKAAAAVRDRGENGHLVINTIVFYLI